ncbi:hypothetical protein [Burkholderia vietnamiensis]|uniref:hypothetical protein n=1 Tax=Burkholderia vietnamiensis TaxID=60552 RepID=UPI0012D9FBCE|nr:hypothetical protein [Burkholderia vietnamiensis]HDR9159482.1 hypothetical protein [Burkholderia vietnamiensis]
MSFWPQTLVDYFQIASAIGTCGAVVISLLLANRGIQTKLETSCRVIRAIGAPSLKVVVRNVGRDTVYLVAIGGTADDGTERSERFIGEEGHLTIPSGAPNTIAIQKHLTVTQPSDGRAKQWVRMWVKDVSGKRFHISGSTECLAEIWSEMEQEPRQLVAGRDFPV